MPNSRRLALSTSSLVALLMAAACSSSDDGSGGNPNVNPFVPGGGSLHNQMSAHGPDRDAFEKASNAELKPQKLEGTMAFMFESRYIIRPTKFAMDCAQLQHHYTDVWKGLEKKFSA